MRQGHWWWVLGLGLLALGSVCFTGCAEGQGAPSGVQSRHSRRARAVSLTVEAAGHYRASGVDAMRFALGPSAALHGEVRLTHCRAGQATTVASYSVAAFARPGSLLVWAEAEGVRLLADVGGDAEVTMPEAWPALTASGPRHAGWTKSKTLKSGESAAVWSARVMPASASERDWPKGALDAIVAFCQQHTDVEAIVVSIHHEPAPE